MWTKIFVVLAINANLINGEFINDYCRKTDVAFLIDRSGSFKDSGKLGVAVDALVNAIDVLPIDTEVSIVYFSGEKTVLEVIVNEQVIMNDGDRDSVKQQILSGKDVVVHGQTHTVRALEATRKMYFLPDKIREDSKSLLIVLTDGQIFNADNGNNVPDADTKNTEKLAIEIDKWVALDVARAVVGIKTISDPTFENQLQIMCRPRDGVRGSESYCVKFAEVNNGFGAFVIGRSFCRVPPGPPGCPAY